MESKRILPEGERKELFYYGSKTGIDSYGIIVGHDTMEKIKQALEACESELQKEREEKEKIEARRLSDIHFLDQSYRKQFEWIAQSYPEVYKQIPDHNKLNYGFITRNEAARIQASNEKSYHDEIQKLWEENQRLKEEVEKLKKFNDEDLNTH